MIDFEEELKRFSPIPGVNQAEEAIYNNDLKDISDIVSQVVEEIADSQPMQSQSVVGRIRR